MKGRIIDVHVQKKSKNIESFKIQISVVISLLISAFDLCPTAGLESEHSHYGQIYGSNKAMKFHHLFSEQLSKKSNSSIRCAAA